MDPKCSQLTVVFSHLHMKACKMNRRGGSGVQTHGASREHGPHANGRNYKKSGLQNLFLNILLKRSLADL